MPGSSRKIHSAVSGVCYFRFVICDGHLSRPGGRGRQCREPLEKALEPLVESLGEVLCQGLHSSFATDGFGTGLSLLKLQCGLMLAALCLNFPD